MIVCVSFMYIPFPHIFFRISHWEAYMTPSLPHTGSPPIGHIRGHAPPTNSVKKKIKKWVLNYDDDSQIFNFWIHIQLKLYG